MWLLPPLRTLARASAILSLRWTLSFSRFTLPLALVMAEISSFFCGGGLRSLGIRFVRFAFGVGTSESASEAASSVVAPPLASAAE
jgi:hypothetical protein